MVISRYVVYRTIPLCYLRCAVRGSRTSFVDKAHDTGALLAEPPGSAEPRHSCGAVAPNFLGADAAKHVSERVLRADIEILKKERRCH